VRELQPGLWHWQSPHPEWPEGAVWPREVSSYALDDGARLLLFDPLAVPDELLGLDREVAVVLTAPWHERDAQSLGVPVHAPPADTQQDLMDKYGLTADQAAGGSPDLRWLGDARLDLPAEFDVFPGREHNDVVLWIESRRVIVAGDSLVDFGRGLEIPRVWLREGVTQEQVAEALRPLLELPVELVLPAHGAPTHRAALEHALS
jgi:glyoxylase-like metal-dependent hydrolase (beta-lactamase superfamily II)